MKYSKKALAAAGITGVIGIAGISATTLAATSSGSSSYPPIVQKLASTFGLDPSKVNDVFKQQRQDNQTDRQARLKTVLDQAVKDGKLTSDQETKLIDELRSLHDQAKTDHQDIKSRLDQWAKDNGITNLSDILPTLGPGLHHHMMDNDGDADDSGTTSSSN